MGHRGRPVRAIPPLLKHMNARTVLEVIREGAPISRAEISRRSGISKPTVSLALRSLLDARLVREAEEGPAGPRFGAVYFEPAYDAAHVLAFDLGARFVRGALCDLSGRIRARQDVELRAADADDALRAIDALRGSLVDAAGVDPARIDGSVVGVPAAVDAERGTLHLAGNVAGLEAKGFAAALRERLGQAVRLENDVNLAALGEQWRGIAHGVDDFAFLSVGTGMGAGLVLGGDLHRGHHGVAGELGFAMGGSLRHELDPSARAIAAMVARLLEQDAMHTDLVPPYRAPDVFAAARRGDRLARAAVAEVARRIALHVAPLAAVADVALVVLGGGIGANGDLLLEPVRAHLAEWTPYPPRVEVSSLGEAAVLTGALAVGLEAALENVFVPAVGQRAGSAVSHPSPGGAAAPAVGAGIAMS